MKSSIYISSEKIEVIGYAGGTVKRYLTTPLAEGTMINGMITDPVFLTECLTALRAKNPELFKNPELVVDGSTILSKRISAPKLNRRRYEQLVRDDFAETVEDPDELVCGYQVDSGGALYACAANKAQIDSYISTFHDAGIKLKAVRIGTQAIFRYVNAQTELKNKTFVLNIVDGFMLLSMLFSNGSNVFMSRTRLYGEEKEQLFQNILENLSGLVQFTRSEKFDDISASYYLGLDEQDIRLLDALNPHTDIRMGKLDIFQQAGGRELLPADAHFVYLNTLLGTDSIDFIRGRRELTRHIKRRKSKKTWIPLLLATLILLALPVLYLRYLLSGVDGEIGAVRQALDSPAMTGPRAELEEIGQDTAFFRDIIRQRDEREAWDDTRISINSRVLALVTDVYAEKVTVTQFDYSDASGLLRVGGSSANDADSAEYVERLKRNELVASVKYTGYSYGSDGNYNFSIDVKLAAGGTPS